MTPKTKLLKSKWNKPKKNMETFKKSTSNKKTWTFKIDRQSTSKNDFQMFKQ